MASKRNLERRLDALNAPSKEYPDASIAQILSSDTHEVVDREHLIVELDYGTFHVSQSMVETLTRTVEDD